MVGLARAGLFPRAFARVSGRRGTPVNALLFTLALCLGLGWLGEGALTWFLDTGGVYVGLAWFIGVASMYWIRRRYPRVESPYRVPVSFLPAIGGVVAVLVILLTLVPGTDISLAWPSEYVILLAWFALGTVIYAIAPQGARRTRSRGLGGRPVREARRRSGGRRSGAVKRLAARRVTVYDAVYDRPDERSRSRPSAEERSVSEEVSCVPGWS
jgi:Amino acid permease